ncbi:MAG: hypothetical protein R3C71_13080 [Candidatus Krumholzibacteriia bacterium]
MKRNTLTLTLVAGLLLVAATALAKPNKPGDQYWRQMKDPREMTEAFRLYKMTEYLELTEDQTAKIFPRMAALRKAQDESMDQIRDKQKELRELVDKEDWSKGAKLADEIFAMKGAQMQKQHQAMDEIRKLLNDEQRAKMALFERRFAGHMERMHERFQGDGPGMGPGMGAGPHWNDDDDDMPPPRRPRGR